MGDTPGGPDVPQDYLVLGKMIYEFMPGSQDEMEVEFELDPEEQLYAKMLEQQKEKSIKTAENQKKALVFAFEATKRMEIDNQYKIIREEFLKFVKNS